ncbi:PREDICTED: NAP1-related protein 1-like [Erythranthe guttata]|uniref:NAP1-related protein 1-like n=1 Tax=Erythranthe guttata TaxID=4155 RepID=UPI00064D8172|nr:PREDICTED: NAP1-related protein 1-like [Erythranthe guttata]|eukprot:XP_012840863.1 PREDICTED: NAP1-related protein 1-like [Erythranthe guttata]
MDNLACHVGQSSVVFSVITNNGLVNAFTWTVTDKLVKKTEELERKYDQKKVPIYDRRSLVINSIPDFWLTAFLKHPTLGTLLTQEDQQIFRYLDSIHVEDLKYPQKGYCITFNFKINPYFENETLSKTVDYTDEDLETTCTTIRWKEGKAPPAISAIPVEERDKRLLPFITRYFFFSTPVFE